MTGAIRARTRLVEARCEMMFSNAPWLLLAKARRRLRLDRAGTMPSTFVTSKKFDRRCKHETVENF